jgi:hypothetical protein
MATALWYINNGSTRKRQRKVRKPAAVKRRLKLLKGNKTMATTQTNPNEDNTQAPAQPTKTVTRTVFDIQKFDDVKLQKVVPLPAKPATIEEALAAVGNDSSKLLDVIYEGLVGQQMDAEYNNIKGFKVVGEDGELGEDYTGQYADESKTKLINAAVLTFAKLNAGGTWDTLSKEKKRELKDNAIAFMRSNPAMLASIQG